jgi:hypothetical protein
LSFFPENETMRVLNKMPVKFDTNGLMKALHIEKDSDDERDFMEMVELASSTAKPKAIFNECHIEDTTPDSVRIHGVVFRSRVLSANLDKVNRVFPFTATCGIEFDEIVIPGDDILKQYWLDELKTSALASACDSLFSLLKSLCGAAEIASMSPGSGDPGVWELDEQRPLFFLLGDTESLIGVTLTEDCLLIPNKTISGIAYQSEATFESCRLCRRLNCPSRLANFDETLWRNMLGEQR